MTASVRFLLILALALPMACTKEAKPPSSEEDEKPRAKEKQTKDDDEDEQPKAKKKKKSSIEGPRGFPLPADATSKGNAPGGGGKIVTYEVPRARDDVADELEKLLEDEGFTIDSKEKSPKGSRRLSASKDGKTFKASVAGEGEQSAIILTLP